MDDDDPRFVPRALAEDGTAGPRYQPAPRSRSANGSRTASAGATVPSSASACPSPRVERMCHLCLRRSAIRFFKPTGLWFCVDEQGCVKRARLRLLFAGRQGKGR